MNVLKQVQKYNNYVLLLKDCPREREETSSNTVIYDPVVKIQKNHSEVSKGGHCEWP